MNAVSVLIYLPPDVYMALVKKADAAGTQVHTLVEHALTKSVRGRRNGKVNPDVSEAIWHMNKAGLSDNKIAGKLGMAQSTVTRHRQALGLASPTPRAEGSGRKAKAVDA